MENVITIIIIVLVAIGLVALTVFLIINKTKVNRMIKQFKKCNVIVDGKKGTGKDLVFNYVIHKRKKEDYYSNISYGLKYHNVQIKDISVSPNTYEKFIINQVVKVPRLFKEQTDIYISDGGIFLPSYMDSILYKKFPSFPIYYALSRHLYNSNVHVNVQNFTRLWKAIREQADFFVHVRKTIKIGPIFITLLTCYDKYESAVRYLEPMKSRLLNNQSKAQVDLYKAENGLIQKCFIIQTKHNITYNSRAFEKQVLKGRRLNHCLSEKNLQKRLESC